MQYKGVNISGLEFGSGNKAWVNYAIPEKSHFDYWGQHTEANIVRIPFKWERIQTKLDGELNQEYLNYVKQAVNHAHQNGMTAILDLHNYGRYNDKKIGTGDVKPEHLADVWKKLGNIFDGQPNVWLNLMNEPHGFKAADWAQYTQKVVNILRAEGIDNKLLLSGTEWSGAHSWVKSGNAKAYEGFHDPLNNFAFDVHQYLDKWSTGTHGRVEAGYGSKALKDITEWAKQHDMQLFLGETGAADPSIAGQQHSLTELRAMFDVMEANPDVWMGWTLWGAGPWWGDNYHFNINPVKLGNGNFKHDTVISQILDEFRVQTPANNAPDAVNDSAKGLQDAIIKGNVLANDRDADNNKLTAKLDDAPDHGKVVLNGDGTYSYTPNKGFVGQDRFTYEANDGKGGTDKATVTLTVEALPKTPVIKTEIFNFKAQPVVSYSSDQDRHGATTISDDGKAITLTGNSWKSVKLSTNQTITKDSVLSFEFRSTKEGEIQGIGFDNDSRWDNGQPTWQLYGNQAADFTNNSFDYTNKGNWQSFSISLAKYAGQSYSNLFLMNDNDADVAGVNVSFRNIAIHHGGDSQPVKDLTPISRSLDFYKQKVSSYSGEQDRNGNADISGNGKTITLTGNSWKSVQLPEVETFTNKSMLRFDFKSTKEGEVQGIGFDNDDRWDNGQPVWQLFGTQDGSDFANTNIDYTNKGDWQSFTISLAKFAGQSYSNLFLMNDNDANIAGVNASFRNIEVFEG